MSSPSGGGNQEAISGAGKQKRAELKAAIEKDKALLDPDTYAELTQGLNRRGDGTYRPTEELKVELEKAKEGVGIYGIRRANSELVSAMRERPGNRQTILTSGQNTSGVGSTGLLSTITKK